MKESLNGNRWILSQDHSAKEQGGMGSGKHGQLHPYTFQPRPEDRNYLAPLNGDPPPEPNLIHM